MLSLWDDLKPTQAMAAAALFKHRKLLLALPRQEGKTELGVRLARDVTRRPWTSSCLYLAKDRKAGKKATREKFLRLFPKSVFEVNTEIVYLKKYPGSCIYMDSVDKDPSRLRGGTYEFIHWSEVAFSKLESGVTVQNVIEQILKWTQRETGRYFLCESTMFGPNGWKDLWDNAKSLGFATLKISYDQMLEMGLVTQAAYDEEKKNTHPLVFAQEMNCEFVSFEGLVYSEFDPKYHIYEAMPPPSGEDIVVSAIDWGWRPSATCVLFAYVKNGILNVFDEIYEMEQLPKQTGESIEQVKFRWNLDQILTVGDHEPDRNEELTLRGIPVAKAKKSNVLGTRLQIKELMHFKRIRFHPRCKNVIKDVMHAKWNPKKHGELDEGQCTWGHYDGEAALRYLVREANGVEAKPMPKNPHAQTGDLVSGSEWQNIERKKHVYNPW